MAVGCAAVCSGPRSEGERVVDPAFEVVITAGVIYRFGAYTLPVRWREITEASSRRCGSRGTRSRRRRGIAEALRLVDSDFVGYPTRTMRARAP